MTDGLRDAHRAAIIDLLRANKRVGRAVLFGSRATETFTPESDVDIALFGEELTIADQTSLATAMEELNIPQRVDLVLHDRIEDAALRKRVQRDGIELYRRQRIKSSSRLDLPERHCQILASLLRKHLPGVEVWAGGSRVSGASRPASDLDMVVFAKPEQAQQVSDLREAFEERNLPFRVDLSVWDDLPEDRRAQFEREHFVLTAPQDGVDTEWDGIAFSEAVQLNPKVRIERGKAYPFIEMAAISPGHRSVYAAQLRDFCGSGSRFQTGDTLMARITPCLENGKVARYVADDELGVAHGSTEFIVIRGRPGVSDTEFSYYLTQWDHVRDFSVDQMTGTPGRQRVPVEAFDHLRVSMPSLSEQRAIARVLGTFDDKIDLNRRMNETLEAMARAIFKDWFVDFGPTRAKAEGRAPYLAAELWKLFPDALDDEGKPVGWTLAPLSVLAEANPESWSKKNAPEEIVYVDLANTKWGSIDATHHFLWQDAPSRAKRILRPGDTIVGLVRPGNGSFAYIGTPGLTGSTGFAVLRPREPRYAELVFLSATATENIERLAHLARGAAYPAVRPEVVEATQVAIADNVVTTSFSALIAPIFERMERNRTESRTLAQTRDLLLPGLMSGEIRLLEAEHAMEAVA